MIAMPVMKINNALAIDKLQDFVESLNRYTFDFLNLFTSISLKLPEIERQIDLNLRDARELLDFISSDESVNSTKSIKGELDTFHLQLGDALFKLKETEDTNKSIFCDLESSIDISLNALDKIEDIYDISEELKVFAINSIINARREGTRGKGYQLISSRFVGLSGEIAKGALSINEISRTMKARIDRLTSDISSYEQFNRNHIQAVSMDSQNLMKASGKTVSNLSMILNDLLYRIEALKKPAYDIMIKVQNQDIIQQQMEHMEEFLKGIIKIGESNSELLSLEPYEIEDSVLLGEYRNLYTLLFFLFKTTEEQILRINRDIQSMLEEMESDFDHIIRQIRDIDSDKNMIIDLVAHEGENSHNSVILLIFKSPKETLQNIIANLKKSRQLKSEIIELSREIHNFIQIKITAAQEFIPVTQSINSLLLLARIERERNNLSFSRDSFFSEKSFSDLKGIIDEMEVSGEVMGSKLDAVEKVFDNQKEEYSHMERSLAQSFSIIENAEMEFIRNFDSVMAITGDLSGEIEEYYSLFSNLRELHGQMDSKIGICREMRRNIEKKLETLGGPLNMSECTYRDSAIREILGLLTVEKERESIANQFSELEIEKSTGSSITLF